MSITKNRWEQHFLSLKKKSCFFELTEACLFINAETLSDQTVTGLFLAVSVRLIKPCQSQRPSYLTYCMSLQQTRGDRQHQTVSQREETEERNTFRIPETETSQTWSLMSELIGPYRRKRTTVWFMWVTSLWGQRLGVTWHSNCYTYSHSSWHLNRHCGNKWPLCVCGYIYCLYNLQKMMEAASKAHFHLIIWIRQRWLFMCRKWTNNCWLYCFDWLTSKENWTSLVFIKWHCERVICQSLTGWNFFLIWAHCVFQTYWLNKL